MKKGIAIVFFIFFYICSYGQNDYVITTQGDTVKGEVQILLPSEKYEEIIIKTDNDNRRLKAFQFLEIGKDSLRYKSVKNGEVYRIMQLEKEGYLSLLSFRSEGNYAFGSKYLLKKTGEGIEVPTLLFKKVMSDFLSDCEEVETKLEDRVYKRNDLEDIVINYNECILNKTRDLYTTATKTNTVADLKSNEETGPSGIKLSTIKTRLQTIKSSEAPELMVLLNDIEAKLQKGEKIPSYMISALKEQASKLNDTNITGDVAELIELIKQ